MEMLNNTAHQETLFVEVMINVIGKIVVVVVVVIIDESFNGFIILIKLSMSLRSSSSSSRASLADATALTKILKVFTPPEVSRFNVDAWI